jgi:hypothetical protein
MGIIGKIYANSMLVLINSRMLLTFEETRLTIISAAKFGTAPTNDIDSVIEGHRGDSSVDTDWMTRISRSSEV